MNLLHSWWDLKESSFFVFPKYFLDCPPISTHLLWPSSCNISSFVRQKFPPILLGHGDEHGRWSSWSLIANFSWDDLLREREASIVYLQAAHDFVSTWCAHLPFLYSSTSSLSFILTSSTVPSYLPPFSNPFDSLGCVILALPMLSCSPIRMLLPFKGPGSFWEALELFHCMPSTPCRRWWQSEGFSMTENVNKRFYSLCTCLEEWIQMPGMESAEERQPTKHTPQIPPTLSQLP